MHVNLFQSCPTLDDPMDCNLLGSSVHRILQARILEWVATPPLGDLPNSGMEHTPSASRWIPTESPGKPWCDIFKSKISKVKLFLFVSNNFNLKSD